MARSHLFLLASIGLTTATDLSTLPALLKNISADIFPDLKGISQDIYAHPETSLQEFHAHDTVVDYFTTTKPGLWDVKPHVYNLPTAFQLDFVHKPAGYTGSEDEIPVVGIMAEYDALIGIGHACGHNHILLNGLAAASMARQALIALDIPGRIRILGTPDEENTGGKGLLRDAGAFDEVDMWMMAHPTSANAVQPMGARVDAQANFVGDTHADAVRTAYEALVLITDLGTTLPSGTTATPVEDVGMFAINVVSQKILLGIAGLSLQDVNATVGALLDSTYIGVNYTVAEDDEVEKGIAVTMEGPGGHASEGTKSPLRLSIETFRNLTNSGKQGISFFLPGNITATELDITISVRPRYTMDLDSLLKNVTSTITSKAKSITTDRPYPALEVLSTPGDRFINLMHDADHDSQTNWNFSTIAPAATDAGFVQDAVLDPSTKQVLSTFKAVFHPNFGICEPVAGAPCGFNHEPEFEQTAGTEYSYGRTEIVARALAQIAVELLDDKAFMREATKLVRK
ncbi:uncharacterized protein F4807DRAFT_436587 [Annulohypoxylon truncatum]|uniref:uncharacterized protein n=1 Tax=Annulohypoxylon truncatum TaxID=327061 RepID=UPI002007381A|nr:uncharacterized protein F4807DRAFT_436587 [Annulohypoxylon truncatum]KAI1206982.1 hypothetical protein F4807DRAFT_436587 [Annulohypoxylon truncatum]